MTSNKYPFYNTANINTLFGKDGDLNIETMTMIDLSLREQGAILRLIELALQPAMPKPTPPLLQKQREEEQQQQHERGRQRNHGVELSESNKSKDLPDGIIDHLHLKPQQHKSDPQPEKKYSGLEKLRFYTLILKNRRKMSKQQERLRTSREEKLCLDVRNIEKKQRFHEDDEAQDVKTSRNNTQSAEDAEDRDETEKKAQMEYMELSLNPLFRLINMWENHFYKGKPSEQIAEMWLREAWPVRIRSLLTFRPSDATAQLTAVQAQYNALQRQTRHFERVAFGENNNNNNDGLLAGGVQGLLSLSLPTDTLSRHSRDLLASTPVHDPNNAIAHLTTTTTAVAVAAANTHLPASTPDNGQDSNADETRDYPLPSYLIPATAPEILRALIEGRIIDVDQPLNIPRFLIPPPPSTSYPSSGIDSTAFGGHGGSFAATQRVTRFFGQTPPTKIFGSSPPVRVGDNKNKTSDISADSLQAKPKFHFPTVSSSAIHNAMQYPLMIAIKAGALEIVRLLLDYGANVHSYGGYQLAFCQPTAWQSARRSDDKDRNEEEKRGQKSVIEVHKGISAAVATVRIGRPPLHHLVSSTNSSALFGSSTPTAEDFRIDLTDREGEARIRSGGSREATPIPPAERMSCSVESDTSDGHPRQKEQKISPVASSSEPNEPLLSLSPPFFFSSLTPAASRVPALAPPTCITNNTCNSASRSCISDGSPPLHCVVVPCAGTTTTPLYIAVTNNFPHIAQLLIDYGAGIPSYVGVGHLDGAEGRSGVIDVNEELGWGLLGKRGRILKQLRKRRLMKRERRGREREREREGHSDNECESEGVRSIKDRQQQQQQQDRNDQSFLWSSVDSSTAESDDNEEDNDNDDDMSNKVKFYRLENATITNQSGSSVVGLGVAGGPGGGGGNAPIHSNPLLQPKTTFRRREARNIWLLKHIPVENGDKNARNKGGYETDETHTISSHCTTQHHQGEEFFLKTEEKRALHSPLPLVPTRVSCADCDNYENLVYIPTESDAEAYERRKKRYFYRHAKIAVERALAGCCSSSSSSSSEREGGEEKKTEYTKQHQRNDGSQGSSDDSLLTQPPQVGRSKIRRRQRVADLHGKRQKQQHRHLIIDCLVSAALKHNKKTTIIFDNDKDYSSSSADEGTEAQIIGAYGDDCYNGSHVRELLWSAVKTAPRNTMNANDGDNEDLDNEDEHDPRNNNHNDRGGGGSGMIKILLNEGLGSGFKKKELDNTHSSAMHSEPKKRNVIVRLLNSATEDSHSRGDGELAVSLYPTTQNHSCQEQQQQEKSDTNSSQKVMNLRVCDLLCGMCKKTNVYFTYQQLTKRDCELLYGNGFFRKVDCARYDQEEDRGNNSTTIIRIDDESGRHISSSSSLRMLLKKVMNVGEKEETGEDDAVKGTGEFVLDEESLSRLLLYTFNNPDRGKKKTACGDGVNNTNVDVCIDALQQETRAVNTREEKVKASSLQEDRKAILHSLSCLFPGSSISLSSSSSSTATNVWTSPSSSACSSSPVFAAIENWREDLMRFLLEYGRCDPNVRRCKLIEDDEYVDDEYEDGDDDDDDDRNFESHFSSFAVYYTPFHEVVAVSDLAEANGENSGNNSANRGGDSGKNRRRGRRINISNRAMIAAAVAANLADPADRLVKQRKMIDILVRLGGDIFSPVTTGGSDNHQKEEKKIDQSKREGDLDIIDEYQHRQPRHDDHPHPLCDMNAYEIAEAQNNPELARHIKEAMDSVRRKTREDEISLQLKANSNLTKHTDSLAYT